MFTATCSSIFSHRNGKSCQLVAHWSRLKCLNRYWVVPWNFVQTWITDKFGNPQIFPIVPQYSWSFCLDEGWNCMRFSRYDNCLRKYHDFTIMFKGMKTERLFWFNKKFTIISQNNILLCTIDDVWYPLVSVWWYTVIWYTSATLVGNESS